MIRINMSLFPVRFHTDPRRLIPAIVMVFMIFLAGGCKKDSPEEPVVPDYGKIVFQFDHKVDGEDLLFDTLMYTNAAGNPYLVNEIQYFISDVKLYREDQEIVPIDDWKELHYVDTDLPETMEWQVYDKIPPGKYDSINFRFGIAPEKNISFMFPNPPERDMFWPEYLGGGYHYMKLNGKWLPPPPASQTLPFDFHMGTGQIYDDNTDSIIGFVPNDFIVSLKNSGFTITAGQTSYFAITMNVEKWFKEPNTYDHNQYGGYIMQNQEAMQKAKENGHNVFTFAENIILNINGDQ